MTSVFSIDPESPVVLLDWSNIVFWRFFATKSWYVRVNTYTSDVKLADDSTFVESFTRSFIKAIESLRKKHGAPKGNVIALMDAPRATLWRKAVFPAYKDNRDLRKSPIEREFFDIAEGLQAQLNLQSVRIATLEADDLAYLFKRRLMVVGAKKIIMVSDDNDWGQLAVTNDDVQIRVVNVDDKDIGVRCGCLQQKILCGDPGDNIPPAFNRCGKVTAARFACNADALEAYFVKDPPARDTYERNRLLIDLSCIPQEHVDAFDAAVELVLIPA